MSTYPRALNLFLGISLTGVACLAEVGPLELYYNSAASFSSGSTSQEAIPIGNGKMAAMVYGGVGTEMLQFNEDTVWAGTVHDYTRPGAYNWLDDIQAAIWAGEGEKAYNDYAAANFMSDPIRQSCYVGAGVLEIHTGTQSFSNYRRSLDLENATSRVTYESGGVTYERETFASYPDGVIVMKLSASEPASINLSEISFTSLHMERTVMVEGNHLVMNAKVNDEADQNFGNSAKRQQTSGIHFQARLEVRNEGGSLGNDGDAISVSGSDAVVLILHVATNFVRFDDLSGDPDTRAKAVLAAVAGKSYEDLRAAHVADYQELFNRVVLDLGTTADANQPTDQRLEGVTSQLNRTVVKEAYKVGDIETFTDNLDFTDPQLITLNFQMARYLMISGSRPGSQPMNLQGKWCNELDPSWESKMTLNINQEMNYWAAETANLPEAHVPMVDLVRDLTETGAKAASNHYNADGWMVHHNTDLWRGTAPINNPGGMWPSGGAWLSMHLWWHYQYGQDPAVLEDIYPLMKGAAEFFVDFLVMDPRSPSDAYPAWGNQGRPQWGQYLLTNPSHSPEQPNKYLEDNGELVAGTTMDSQLIRGLFTYVIEAGGILGVDAGFRQTLEEKRALLPPNQVSSTGKLQEWLEDVEDPPGTTDSHRHLSHLVDLFPGEGIHPVYEPELAQAARLTLDAKGYLSSRNTSWSRAWKMNLRAVLGEGDAAFMILYDLLGKSHTDNMTFSYKGNGEDQIDGNLGACMGTAQLFLQSRRDEIHLLPALPSLLPAGSITGLRAKSNFEVDITWEAGALTQAIVHSFSGMDCRLRVDEPVQVTNLNSGQSVVLSSPGAGLYEFSTDEGISYLVEPASGSNTWAGYPVVEDGLVNSAGFLGWLHVGDEPFIWSYALSNWLYINESDVESDGAWIYVYQR